MSLRPSLDDGTLPGAGSGSLERPWTVFTESGSEPSGLSTVKGYDPCKACPSMRETFL